MKILIVSHEFPPVGGGGANACMYLSKEYVKAGHAVTVVTVNYENMPEKEILDGVRLIRVNAKRTHKEHCGFGEMASYLMKAWPVVNHLQKQEPYDICQVFFGIPSGPLGYLLHVKYKLPYVIRFGGGDIPGFQDRFAFIYKAIGPFLKAIWRKADGLVANSEGLKQLALDFYDRCEVQIINNGVDADKFYPVSAKQQTSIQVQQNDETQPVRILFVSRLIERKGLQFIIPMLKDIQEKSGRNVRLTIVGDGPYRETLEQIVKENHAKECVEFVGQKEKAEILAYYQNADLFILPSKKEGMPNVVLEAMASGLPIVMTPCQGSKELVTDNGVITSIEGFQSALIQMCADDELRIQMGQNSRRNAVECFSWTAIAEQYMRLFQLVKK